MNGSAWRLRNGSPKGICADGCCFNEPEDDDDCGGGGGCGGWYIGVVIACDSPADFGGTMAGLSCACSAGAPSDGREYCGGGGGRRSMTTWEEYCGDVALEVKG